MVKNFKGEVKISDIQNEFDSISDRLNTMIDAYNGVLDKSALKDYTLAGKGLSAPGYTLTVGGIKQALTALDGRVLGSKVFYNSKNKAYITDGLLFTNYGCFKLPTQALDKPTWGQTIWYDTVEKVYAWSTKMVPDVKLKDEYDVMDKWKVGTDTEGNELFQGFRYRTYYATQNYWTRAYYINNYTKDSNKFFTAYTIGDGGGDNRSIEFLPCPRTHIPLGTINYSIDVYNKHVTYNLGDGTVNKGKYYWDDYKTDDFTPYYYAGANKGGSTLCVALGYYDGDFNPEWYYYTEWTEKFEISAYKEVNPAEGSGGMVGDYTYCMGGSGGLVSKASGTYYVTSKIISENILYGLERHAVTYPDFPHIGTSWENYEAFHDHEDCPSDKKTYMQVPIGARFTFYHDIVYSNKTEKDDKNSLPISLLCRIDYINQFGEILKTWQPTGINDADSDSPSGYNSTTGDVISQPVIMELWKSSHTMNQINEFINIEKYKDLDEYLRRFSPLAKCNTVGMGCPHYNVSFKQGEISNKEFVVDDATFEVFNSDEFIVDPKTYRITDIAISRESNDLNDIKSLELRDVDGTVKITTQSRKKDNIGYPNCNETIDTSSSGCFVSGCSTINQTRGGWSGLNLLGTEVDHYDDNGHRKLSIWTPTNYLYLPRGVDNPYRSNTGKHEDVCMFPFVANVEKDLS